MKRVKEINLTESSLLVYNMLRWNFFNFPFFKNCVKNKKLLKFEWHHRGWLWESLRLKENTKINNSKKNKILRQFPSILQSKIKKLNTCCFQTTLILVGCLCSDLTHKNISGSRKIYKVKFNVCISNVKKGSEFLFVFSLIRVVTKWRLNN